MVLEDEKKEGKRGTAPPFRFFPNKPLDHVACLWSDSILPVKPKNKLDSHLKKKIAFACVSVIRYLKDFWFSIRPFKSY